MSNIMAIAILGFLLLLVWKELGIGSRNKDRQEKLPPAPDVNSFPAQAPYPQQQLYQNQQAYPAQPQAAPPYVQPQKEGFRIRETRDNDKSTVAMSYWQINYSSRDGFIPYDLPLGSGEKAFFTIGRAADSDLILKDEPTVGKFHAYIANEETGPVLYDHDSLNGIFAEPENGGDPVRVSSIPITDGLVAYIGKAQLVFRRANPFTPASPPPARGAVPKPAPPVRSASTAATVVQRQEPEYAAPAPPSFKEGFTPPARPAPVEPVTPRAPAPEGFTPPQRPAPPASAPKPVTDDDNETRVYMSKEVS